MTVEIAAAVLLIAGPDRVQPGVLRARSGLRLPEHPAQGARRDPASLRGRRLRADPALGGAARQRAPDAAAGGAAGRRARRPRRRLSVLSIVVGAAAALVQGLGLVRWPFAVPELARGTWRRPTDPAGDATRQTVEAVFATLHRLLGVGIGEHLGYLFTGLWTLLVAGSILSTAILPSWLGIVGLADRDRPLGRHPRVRRAQRA